MGIRVEAIDYRINSNIVLYTASLLQPISIYIDIKWLENIWIYLQLVLIFLKYYFQAILSTAISLIDGFIQTMHAK